MYTLELTDNYILIFNHKTNILSKEEIPCNIIINNKIYDFLKLNNIMYDIINKYKILNSLFKVKIKFKKYGGDHRSLCLLRLFS